MALVHKDGETVAARYLYRDHHAEDGSRPRRNRIHAVETDVELEAGSALKVLVMMAGLKDGDEFEVTVTPTGERPHGDRWFLFPKYRPETDEECLARIQAMDGQPVQTTYLGSTNDGTQYKLKEDDDGDKTRTRAI